MQLPKGVVWLISFLSLAVFGGLSVAVKVVSRNFVSAVDLGVNRELAWDSKKHRFEAEEPNAIASRIVLIANGCCEARDFVVQMKSKQLAESPRLLVAAREYTDAVLSPDGSHTGAYDDKIRIDGIRVPSDTMMGLVTVLPRPATSASLSDNTIVRLDGTALSRPAIVASPAWLICAGIFTVLFGFVFGYASCSLKDQLTNIFSTSKRLFID
jgi:hypothetical protein